VVLTVNIADPAKEINQNLDRNGYSFPVGIDSWSPLRVVGTC
jgi:hypothetical protein